MTLADFIADIPQFSKKNGNEKIEIFSWYLHEVKQQERISTAELTACFDNTNEPRLSNLSVFLKALCERKPPRMLKDAKGYRLSADARRELGAKFQVRQTTVKTTAILDALADRVTDPAQKTFLAETLICFKNQAYRAAIVMAWNLAFSDVMDRILKRVDEFNAQRAKAYPKLRQVDKRSDFEDYKESQVIEIARGADILSAGSAKILTEKLNKRNTAAHPSLVVINAVTAEEVINDLVENIILRADL